MAAVSEGVETSTITTLGDKVALPTTIDAVRARRIERALKANMKLTQRSGPTSFTIQTESGRKYKVMLGPQSCNCNRGHYCIHLVFTMLRVLDVPSRDPIIWSRQLKNFEVEQLIKSYEERAENPIKPFNIIKSTSQADTVPISPTESSQSESEDEEACPICLQPMEIDQGLVICRSGCNNKLHHDCMDTWAAEQEKRKERLMCPLCRNFWHDIDSYSYHSDTPHITINNNDVSQGPFQDPWLQPLISIADTTLIKDKRSIPSEHRSISRPWVQMFGQDFVRGLFSKEWTCRENSLRWLGQLLITLLQERKAAVELNGQSVRITTLQECMAGMLSYMAMDPVHKVYITTLALVQAVTVFSAPETKSFLSFVFQPVFEVIFIRCTDPTRRTCLNSSDFLLTVCRYDESTTHFGGVDYLFSFSLSTHNTKDDWKWWLGRMRVILRLLTERPLFFTLPEKRYPQVKDRAPRRSAYGQIHLDSTSMHKRLFKIIDFALKGIGISHFGVRKTASRVLKESIRRASKDPDALIEIQTLLSSLGRNSNPTLTILASVLRQEALKKHKPEGNASNTASFAAAKMTIPKLAAPTIEISKNYDQSKAGILPNNVNQFEPSSSQSTPSEAPPWSRSSSQALSSSPSTSAGSSLVCTPSHALSSSPSTSAGSSLVCTPYHDQLTPKSLFIESDYFKFDNLTDSSTTPCSNAVTPDTARRVEHVVHSVSCGESRREHVDTPPKVERRTSVGLPLSNRGKRPMRQARPQSLPSMEVLFTHDAGLGGLPAPSPETGSPTPSDKAASSASSSGGSEKRSLFAEEDYRLALMRAKQMSLKESPLPHIPAFENTNDIILYSPNGTNGSYIEGVHWKRGQLVGTGGCSTCYCAWDINQGQLMCVKQVSFMRNTESEQMEVIDSVKEEIAMMRQLSHRNIIRLIGAIQLDGHFDIFVEWMPGGSVSSLLDRYGPFNEKVLLNYTKQILLAIDYMHCNRFLHRDLKGANCLVDSSGRHLRIGDFGTSAKINATITPVGQFRGELLGTIAFMAPEVLRGESYGRPCDIWSVGCCMIEMAEGKPPWNARALTNHLALIYKIASATMTPPVPDTMSPHIKDLINRCLESDPLNRPPASDLLQHAVFTRLPDFRLNPINDH